MSLSRSSPFESSTGHAWVVTNLFAIALFATFAWSTWTVTPSEATAGGLTDSATLLTLAMKLLPLGVLFSLVNLGYLAWRSVRAVQLKDWKLIALPVSTSMLWVSTFLLHWWRTTGRFTP